MSGARQRIKKRAACVEFDSDEWALIEGAAARELLSPAEFVREIALAHAVAGEKDELGDEARSTPLARAITADRREKHRVPVAQAKQAVRRSCEQTKRSDQGGDLGNIAYVRRLREAFAAGGAAAMAPLVPPDVIWRPMAAEGRVLHGTRDLLEFWASREIAVPAFRMFHGHDDNVLVEAEFSQDKGRVRTVWLLYRFDGERLIEAIGFPSQAQASRYSLAAPRVRASG